MRVITIGRAPQNDIVINDPRVGRSHLQIIEHDNGRFSIVDLNSTNGTYVNGQRIRSEVPLRPGDQVRIGQTNLQWEHYFNISASGGRDNKKLGIILGSVAGGVVFLVIIALLLFKVVGGGNIVYRGSYPEPIDVSMTNEDGSHYTIKAIAGQVCVWVNDDVSSRAANRLISRYGGKVIAQIPRNGYYLAAVDVDNVPTFIQGISTEDGIADVCPNMVSYTRSVNNYVIDTYFLYKEDIGPDPHGEMVQKEMEKYAGDVPTRRPFNIGMKTERHMCITDKSYSGCVNNEVFAIDSISRFSNDGPIFINMSYGPGLKDRIVGDKSISYYWDSATVEERQDYQDNYCRAIKNTVKNLKPLQGKDYVVVIAAGNDGVKEFDKEIISYLRQHLEPNEIAEIEDHFLLVTADESKRVKKHSDQAKYYDDIVKETLDDQDKKKYAKKRDEEYNTAYISHIYSNEMERGHYDPWVTKVDISDFVYAGRERRGTSFAAPRATGMLSYVASKMDMTGAEVLALAKEVTYKNRILTKEALLQQAKQKKENSSNEYSWFGPIRYRLVPEYADGLEFLEIQNTADVSVRVQGTLLNTIASHDGENTIEIDVTLTPGETKFEQGFITNKCTIIRVDELRPDDNKWQPIPDPKKRKTPTPDPSSDPNPNPNPGEGYSMNGAEKAARELTIAMATGDVSTMRALTTDDMYAELMRNYDTDMAQLDERAKHNAIMAARKLKTENIKTGENTVVVRFRGNGKQFDYYMRYDGSWRCFDYAIGGVHVPKSMRK